MSVSMLRPFFISVAGVVVIVLVGFLCGILPESPFLAFIQAEEVNDYLSAINYFVPVDAFVTIASCCGSLGSVAVCYFRCEDSW